jgi:hypothetical protein
MRKNLCEKSLAKGKRCGKPASIAVIRGGQSVGICADCALKEYLGSKTRKEPLLHAAGSLSGRDKFGATVVTEPVSDQPPPQ